MNKAKLEIFFLAYTAHLIRAVQTRPAEYAYPVDQVPVVVSRMRGAVERTGTFQAVNKDSSAIRATCRELGLKHTYKSINAYLAG